MMTCTLDLYTDYLLSSTGPTTATGLSRLLDGALSHDHVTRWPVVAERPVFWVSSPRRPAFNSRRAKAMFPLTLPALMYSSY